MDGFRLGALMFTAVGIVFVAVGLWQVARPFRMSRRARSWTPVEAEVLELRRERRTRGTGSDRSHYSVTVMRYRYRAPGTGSEHVSSVDLSSRVIAELGGTVTVFVDPADPSRSQHGRPGATAYGCGCVLGGVFVLLGAIAAAVGILLWVTGP